MKLSPPSIRISAVYAAGMSVLMRTAGLWNIAVKASDYEDNFASQSTPSTTQKVEENGSHSLQIAE
jgi:hypothetical protein